MSGIVNNSSIPDNYGEDLNEIDPIEIKIDDNKPKCTGISYTIRKGLSKLINNKIPGLKVYENEVDAIDNIKKIYDETNNDTLVDAAVKGTVLKDNCYTKVDKKQSKTLDDAVTFKIQWENSSPEERNRYSSLEARNFRDGDLNRAALIIKEIIFNQSKLNLEAIDKFITDNFDIYTWWILVRIPKLMPLFYPNTEDDKVFYENISDLSATPSQPSEKIKRSELKLGENVTASGYILNFCNNLPPYIERMKVYLKNILTVYYAKNDTIKDKDNNTINLLTYTLPFNMKQECNTFVEGVKTIHTLEEFNKLFKTATKDINIMFFKSLTSIANKRILGNGITRFPICYPLYDYEFELFTAIETILNSFFYRYGYPHVDNTFNPSKIFATPTEINNLKEYKDKNKALFNSVFISESTGCGGKCFLPINDVESRFNNLWDGETFVESIKPIPNTLYDSAKKQVIKPNNEGEKKITYPLFENLSYIKTTEVTTDANYWIKWQNPTMCFDFLLLSISNIELSVGSVGYIPSINAYLNKIGTTLITTLINEYTNFGWFSRNENISGLFSFSDIITYITPSSSAKTQEFIKYIFDSTIINIFKWNITIPFNSVIGCNYINTAHLNQNNTFNVEKIKWKDASSLLPLYMFLKTPESYTCINNNSRKAITKLQKLSFVKPLPSTRKIIDLTT